jgi:hypothetical protein
LGVLFAAGVAACTTGGLWLNYGDLERFGDVVGALAIVAGAIVAAMVVVAAAPTLLPGRLYDVLAVELALCLAVLLPGALLHSSGGFDSAAVPPFLITAISMVALAAAALVAAITRARAGRALAAEAAEPLMKDVAMDRDQRSFVCWTFTVPTATYVLVAIGSTVAAHFGLPPSDLDPFFGACAPLIGGLIVAVVLQPDPERSRSGNPQHPMARRRRALGLAFVLSGALLGGAGMVPGSGYLFSVAFIAVCASLCAGVAVIAGVILLGQSDLPELPRLPDDLVAPKRGSARAESDTPRGQPSPTSSKAPG